MSIRPGGCFLFPLHCRKTTSPRFRDDAGGLWAGEKCLGDAAGWRWFVRHDGLFLLLLRRFFPVNVVENPVGVRFLGEVGMEGGAAVNLRADGVDLRARLRHA